MVRGRHHWCLGLRTVNLMLKHLLAIRRLSSARRGIMRGKQRVRRHAGNKTLELTCRPAGKSSYLYGEPRAKIAKKTPLGVSNTSRPAQPISASQHVCLLPENCTRTANKSTTLVAHTKEKCFNGGV